LAGQNGRRTSDPGRWLILVVAFRQRGKLSFRPDIAHFREIEEEGISGQACSEDLQCANYQRLRFFAVFGGI
jgi:hypothetical protein